MMLNKNSTKKAAFWKTSLVLPFIFLFMITFNVKTEARVKTSEAVDVSSNYQPDLTAVITKDTKDEDLEKLKEDFAIHGVILEFTEVKRSKEGILTNIALSFKDEKNGHSGSYNHSEFNGIATFSIAIKEGKVSIKSSYQASSSNRSGIGENPLVIVAGKEFKKEDLDGKRVWIKGGSRVIKASEATEKYGSKAKDGVIVISEGEVIEDYEAHLKRMDDRSMSNDRDYLWVRKGQSPMYTKVSGKEKVIPASEEIIAVQEHSNGTRVYFQEEKPLLVVEGEVKDKDFELGELDPDSIKSMNVLKGTSATEKYGEKGKNGVMEIDLKSKEEIENSRKDPKRSPQRKTDKKPVTFTATKVEFEENENKKGTSLAITGVEDAKFDSRDALIIVDGKEMDRDFDANTIAPETIASINVIKGQKAIDLYGQKAKEGVIQITTKKKTGE